jgi:hypothetical protein
MRQRASFPFINARRRAALNVALPTLPPFWPNSFSLPTVAVSAIGALSRWPQRRFASSEKYVLVGFFMSSVWQSFGVSLVIGCPVSA